MKKHFLVLAIGLQLGPIHTALAIDCSRAITGAEIAICNHPELKALDEFLD